MINGSCGKSMTRLSSSSDGKGRLISSLTWLVVWKAREIHFVSMQMHIRTGIADINITQKGTADNFYLQKQLLPENLVEAAKLNYSKGERNINLRLQPVGGVFCLWSFQCLPILLRHYRPNCLPFPQRDILGQVSISIFDKYCASGRKLTKRKTALFDRTMITAIISSPRSQTTMLPMRPSIYSRDDPGPVTIDSQRETNIAFAHRAMASGTSISKRKGQSHKPLNSATTILRHHSWLW